MNRVTLLGNLGQDAELRVSGSGVAVLHLRLATNEPRWDRDASKETPHTEWHDVVFFGSRAEGLSKVLKQGDALLVEGSLRTSSYEKDGVKKFRTEVYARDVFFTGKRRTDAIRPTLPGLQSAAPSDLRF